MRCRHVGPPPRLGRTVLAMVALAALILSTVAVTAMTANAQTPAYSVSATLLNSCRPWLGAAANGYAQAPTDTKSQVEYRIGHDDYL
jgi:hypothetical protein